jgi:phosphate uptake regulator
METRKLQKVGGGTYTVSIPKAWAGEHGFEAGTEVHLYTHVDGSIVLRSSAKDGKELETGHVTVEGTGPEHVRRALAAANATGFETVVLAPADSFTDEQLRAARSMVRRTVGTTIPVERDDRIEVRNLLDASDVSVRQSVLQLQFTALSIHRRATDALTGDGADTYDQLHEHDDEADRLFGMVLRQFNRSLLSLAEVDHLGVSRAELFDYYETARALERVADLGVRIARVAGRVDGPLPEELLDEIRRTADAARDVVDDAAAAVLEDTGVDDAHGALDGRDEVIADLEAIERALIDEEVTDRVSTADAVALARALESLVRTADHGGAVARTAIRAATRAGNLSTGTTGD